MIYPQTGNRYIPTGDCHTLEHWQGWQTALPRAPQNMHAKSDSERELLI